MIYNQMTYAQTEKLPSGIARSHTRREFCFLYFNHPQGRQYMLLSLLFLCFNGFPYQRCKNRTCKRTDYKHPQV